MRRGSFRAAVCVAAVAAACTALAGCASTTLPSVTSGGHYEPTPAETAFLDSLEHRTFQWFWDTTDPRTGLVPDRWPTKSFSSIAAIGFGLNAYVIGAERGWITRQAARDRTLATLRFLWTLPQGAASTGVGGYRGFFYHFLDMQSGLRFRNVELSTIDTGLLLCGVLLSRDYFDGTDPADVEIRSLADSLYRRVDWNWARDDEPSLTMGWRPEVTPDENARGFIKARWIGYNEAMLLYALSLGSPTHAIDPAGWQAWTSGYDWGTFYDESFVQFAPLFAHQYSHAWIDFRGIQDAYMRGRGIDYFENSRRATLSQRAYATANPNGWSAYSSDIWGLTASDGPIDTTMVVDGRERTFHTYWARGAGAMEVRDDGTIAPTAAGGSIAFAPEIAIPALRAMQSRFDTALYGRYGFVDAFNPTLHDSALHVSQGHIVDGLGWFDTDYLGIDQGPIIAMIENYRTELIWRLMRQDPDITRGLCRAGFTGGWLAGRCD